MRLNLFDDYLFHQAIAPLDVPATSDPHSTTGTGSRSTARGRTPHGLRLHPNSNVMDGYGGVLHGGVQRNVRFSRARCGCGRTSPRGRAVPPEIVEPMRVQRIVLDSNPSGVAFDVHVHASAPMTLEEPHVQHRHGVLLNHVLRYSGPTRAEGALVVDGEEHAVDGWYGARDHSWGSIDDGAAPAGPRRRAGGGRNPRAIRIWVPFEAGRLTGFFHTHEGPRGETLDFQGTLWDDGDEVPLTGVRHAFRYDDGRGGSPAASSRCSTRGRGAPSTFERVRARPPRGPATPAAGRTAATGLWAAPRPSRAELRRDRPGRGLGGAHLPGRPPPRRHGVRLLARGPGRRDRHGPRRAHDLRGPTSRQGSSARTLAA